MKEAFCSKGNMHLCLGEFLEHLIRSFSDLNVSFIILTIIIRFLRERVCNDNTDHIDQLKKRTVTSATRATLQSPTKLQGSGELEYTNQNESGVQKASGKPTRTPRRLLKSDSISASRCVGVIRKPCEVCVPFPTYSVAVCQCFA